jgi:pimeloyl-ACP methyl ester carboxylesterase
MSTVMLTHNKVQLALHQLRDGAGRPLLLLHGLGEQSPAVAPDVGGHVAGPGVRARLHRPRRQHGADGRRLFGRDDAGRRRRALAHLGEATVVGRGLGAYVALMLAGARPQQVHGAVLCDGPGLWGGSTGPTSTSYHSVDPPYGAPDPNALIDLSRDLRPPDYAACSCGWRSSTPAPPTPSRLPPSCARHGWQRSSVRSA